MALKEKNKKKKETGGSVTSTTVDTNTTKSTAVHAPVQHQSISVLTNNAGKNAPYANNYKPVPSVKTVAEINGYDRKNSLIRQYQDTKKQTSQIPVLKKTAGAKERNISAQQKSDTELKSELNTWQTNTNELEKQENALTAQIAKAETQEERDKLTNQLDAISRKRRELDKQNKENGNEMFSRNQSELMDSLNDNSRKALEEYYQAKKTSDNLKGHTSSIPAVGNAVRVISALSLNNKEKAVKDVLKTQNIDNFDSAYEYYSMARDKENTTERQKQIAEDYNNSSTAEKVVKNLATLPESVIAGVNTVPELAKGAFNLYKNEYAPLNIYSDAFKQRNDIDTVREETQKNISNKAGNTAATAYNIAMGIGDNVANLPVAALSGGLGLATMGANAASSSAKDATQRGASAHNAALTGISSGLIEAATEKLPMDNLFKTAKTSGQEGVKAALKNILKQSSIEATEEGISEVANTITDRAINGQDSQYELARHAALMNGATWDEATKQANKYVLGNVGMSMLGGAISGGVMGSGATALNRLTRGKNTNADTQNTADTVSDVAKQADNAEIPHQKNTEQSVEKPIQNRETVEDAVSKTEAPNTNVNVNSQNKPSYRPLTDIEKSQVEADLSKVVGDIKRDVRNNVNMYYKGENKRELINAINKCIDDYSVNPTDQNFEKMSDLIDRTDAAMHGKKYTRKKSGVTSVYDNDLSILFISNLDSLCDNAIKWQNGILITESLADGDALNVNGATSNTVPVLHQNANDSFVNKTSEDLWGELEKGNLSRQQAQTDFGQHYENVQALKSDNPNMKVSQTATNTFRKSDLYQNQQFADMVENDIKSGKFNFESVSHEQAYERAGKELAQDYDGQTKRLLNAEWTKGSEDVAMAHLIKQQALETGDMETVSDMAWKTAEQAHKMGQGLEALKTYNATPEGTIQSAYNYSYNRVLKWEKKNAGVVEDMKQVSDSLITALDMNETYKSIRDQVQEQFASHKYTRKMGEDAVTKVTDMLANGESSDAIYNFLARYEAVGMDILDADTTEYVMKRVAEAEKLGDSKKGAEIMQDVYATMADKLGGASGMEKVNAWRYMCMLSSPTTHIANLAGNTSNYLLHHVSRDIQSVLESIANTREKTSSVLHMTSKSDRNLLKQSRDYITNNAYSLYKGKSRVNVKQGIDANKKVFNNKKLEGIRKFESNTLEAEDWIFTKLNGAEYLASYLKANGADASIFNATDAQSKQLLNKAIEYSSQKAKEATYHEASKLAELMGNFREAAENGGIISKIGYTAVNTTIPFASMTENYVKEGARYSPLQLTKAIAETAVPKLRQGVTTADLLEDYAQGLTGSAMVAAGVALGALGIINSSGSDDDEQKEFDELQGLQGYSLNLELNGKKYTYTIDGILGSGGMSLLAGANAYMSMKQNGLTLNDIATSASQLLDPFTEQSFVSSFNDLLQSVSYADEDEKVSAMLASIASSYVQQFFPTLGKRVSNALNGETKTSYSGKTGLANTAAKTGYKIINSIPQLGKVANAMGDSLADSTIPSLQSVGNYLQNANQPYLNAWGENKEVPGGNLGGRLAYQLGSKGFLSEYNTTDIEAALQKVHDNQQNTDTNVFPQTPSSSVTVNGVKRKLEPREYTAYQQSVGNYEKEILSEFIQSDFYKNGDADKQADVINNIYQFSKALTASEMFGNELSGKYEKLAGLYEQYGSEGVMCYFNADYLAKSDSDNKTKDGNDRGLSDSDAVKQYRYLIQSNMSPEQAGEYLYENKATDNECELYDTYGGAALGQYYEFKDAVQGSNENGKYDAKTALFTLKNSDMSDELKGAYLRTAGSIALSENGKNTKAGKIYADLGDAGIYRYYLYKYQADYDGSGSISKDEATDFVQYNIEPSEQNYWFDMLKSSSKTKNPFPYLH